MPQFILINVCIYKRMRYENIYWIISFIHKHIGILLTSTAYEITLLISCTIPIRVSIVDPKPQKTDVEICTNKNFMKSLHT